MVVGILNVTPDSFSDGGAWASTDDAVTAALDMLADGATWIDVGGESTRLGALLVPSSVEAARVVPVIQALRARTKATISVDTIKASVAAAALDAGADVVNDVSGGAADREMVGLVRTRGVPIVVGHVTGATPADAHAGAEPSFDDVVRGLRERLDALDPASRARAIVDPGIGFGKGAARNLELLARAGELGRACGGRPVMVGPSRKRFLAELTGGRPAADRDAATVGACLAAVAAGASYVRVHAVAEMVQALAAFTAVRAAGSPP